MGKTIIDSNGIKDPVHFLGKNNKGLGWMEIIDSVSFFGKKIIDPVLRNK